MGVAAFFRWLTEKYPKVVSEVIEERVAVVDGVGIPVDYTRANPNGNDYDNLYVDMNGLIHPCSHPEDRDAPTTEAEMYVNITKYVDRLFAAVRPRRVLFLAIDGVAPRAKMNQQRSRRFRAARDATERSAMMSEVLNEMQDMGMDAPEGHSGEWDSNVITPGTEFMTRLTAYLHFYILDRMNKHESWRRIKVILSDASEPGEGEHKIMKFVRDQRAQPGYDPNQSHVLHGLDADLIMLALATHELHFNILREKVFFNKRERENKQGKDSEAQQLLDAQTKARTEKAATIASCMNPKDEWLYGKQLEILQVSVLREYLGYEFQQLEQVVPFGYDIERVIDDFIFMCFFVGNDFLPHLPSLDIRDGALDYLMEVYRDMLPSLGDYLTSGGGNLNLAQVDVLLARVGEVEDDVFQRRKNAEDYRAAGQSRQQAQRNGHKPLSGAAKFTQQSSKLQNHAPTTGSMLAVTRKEETSQEGVMSKALGGDATAKKSVDDNKAAAANLRKSLLGKRGADSAVTTGDGAGDVKRSKIEGGDVNKDSGDAETLPSAKIGKKSVESVEEEYVPPPMQKRTMTMAERKEEITRRLKEMENAKIDKLKETVSDDIKLHERGWKSRYYDDTFKKEDIEKGGGLKKMCHAYVQGLVWVMKYYYEGCPSWNWYYPFHYAPFASDLVNIETYPIDMEESKPFRPVEQLLAVLPKESAHALPLACQWLMLNIESPIRDVYDGDVPLDPNGKTLPWLWVLLLPFVEEDAITTAFKACSDKLTLDDLRRNAYGNPLIFLHKTHPLAKALQPSADNGVERAEPIVYGPGPETDEGVLAGLAREAAKLCDDDSDSEEKPKAKKGKAKGTAKGKKSIKNEEDDTAVTAEAPPNDKYVSFSCTEGQGVCGLVSQPAPHFFAGLDSVVVAPNLPDRAFTDIEKNQVFVYKFQFPEKQPHLSKLLEGGIEAQRKLTQYDVSNRRVPRLNRGSASIIDLAQKFRRKDQMQPQHAPQQGNYNQGYQQQHSQGFNGRFPNNAAGNQAFSQMQNKHQQGISSHHQQQQQVMANRGAAGQAQYQLQQQEHHFQQYQQQQNQSFSSNKRGQLGVQFNQGHAAHQQGQSNYNPRGPSNGGARGNLPPPPPPPATGPYSAPPRGQPQISRFNAPPQQQGFSFGRGSSPSAPYAPSQHGMGQMGNMLQGQAAQPYVSMTAGSRGLPPPPGQQGGRGNALYGAPPAPAAPQATGMLSHHAARESLAKTLGKR